MEDSEESIIFYYETAHISGVMGFFLFFFLPFTDKLLSPVVCCLFFLKAFGNITFGGVVAFKDSHQFCW